MAMENLAEKYRPHTLDEVVGNPGPKKEIREWAETWKRIAPQWKGMAGTGKGGRSGDNRNFRPALILAGGPGVGKTTCAHALAGDMGWDVLELNASDARNRGRIRDVVTRGALNQVLSFDDAGEFRSYKEGNLTLIILDEADNLYEKKTGGDDPENVEDFGDRGGKEEIIRAIQLTRHPMILIVNDWYSLVGSSGGALHQCTKTIRFRDPTKDQIGRVLRKILSGENVKARNAVTDIIATRANGDVRGAVNDLEGLIIGRKELRPEDVTTVDRRRDKKKKIFDVMKIILLETDMRKAMRAFRESDEDRDILIEWIAENLPRVYTDSEERARGLDLMSKADVLEGRIRRHQYFGYRWHIAQLVSGGVCASKKHRHRWTKMYFPEHIKIMSQTKRHRRTLKTLTRKVARYLHVSIEYAVTVFLPYYRIMAARDTGLVFSTVYDMGLNRDETALLLEKEYISGLWKQYDNYRVKRIMESTRAGKGVTVKDLETVKDRETERMKFKNLAGKVVSLERPMVPEGGSPVEEDVVPISAVGYNMDEDQKRLDIAPVEPRGDRIREKTSGEKKKEVKKPPQLSLDSFF